MAEIDSLKNRILKESKDKAEAKEREAEAQVREMLKESEEKIQVILNDGKIKGEKEGDALKNRIISKAHMDYKNMILEAKQEALEKIFELVLQRIKEMNKEDYTHFLERLLIHNTETGTEEVILSKNDEEGIDAELLNKVNKELISQGKEGKLILKGYRDSISSGFILQRDGIEINCSPKSQLRLLRDNLEEELVDILFK
ncbi:MULTISPECIES: V-type ATP synthase subunit E [Tissierellales]|jgi:V/A-type H+-transporting ATPase subunit E|uniref:V-type proton ATPase subunit E n=1 Tax=Acidilutibacter cellobiosedens TaxID=2507161 RepID=A0A410QA59_9FIRM|nr:MULTISPECIES: V-type ATP synthase subunit E [Tissierellales]MBE6083228.1 hypothetical protein [Tissierellaceae bacterium]QAT60881.1 hypothetical protein EQM13_04450 [Acidilutibacter cellobiosedens]SCL90646.1 V-type ATP synthase subunit E [Sporanaerobacter sp. PP17-6a]